MSIYENVFKLYNFINIGYFETPEKVNASGNSGLNLDTRSANDQTDYTIDHYDSNAVSEKIFDFSELADFITRNPAMIESLEIWDTEPIVFSIPKTDLTRRIYKYPNIYSYLILGNFIIKNKHEIINRFENDKNSTSKYFNIKEYNFQVTKENDRNLLLNGQYILHLDLANFYPTLYTHSIDWAELGRNNAKANRNRNSSTNLGGQLDFYIRACQFGETHGIPTGTILSRVIAELYMTYFDQRLGEKGFTSFSRYVDDFKFSYISEQEKDNFLLEFNKICIELGLFLNQNKVYIEKYPEGNINDKYFIQNFNSRFHHLTWGKTIRNSYNELIDKSISEEKNGNKGSLKYLISALPGLMRESCKENSLFETVFFKSTSPDAPSVFNRILDTSFSNASLTNNLLHFVDKILSFNIDKEIIENSIEEYFLQNIEKIKLRLSNSLKFSQHQESYQILIYCYQFNIDLDIKIYVDKVFTQNQDDFTVCLTIMLYLRKYSSDSDSMMELVDRLDGLLTQTHDLYKNVKKFSRFQEKFWLVRYFIYTLINSGYIDYQLIKKHCRNNSTKSGRFGYESELNANYIFKDSSDVNDFFKELIFQDIHLINTNNMLR